MIRDALVTCPSRSETSEERFPSIDVMRQMRTVHHAAVEYSSNHPIYIGYSTSTSILHTNQTENHGILRIATRANWSPHHRTRKVCSSQVDLTVGYIICAISTATMIATSAAAGSTKELFASCLGS